METLIEDDDDKLLEKTFVDLLNKQKPLEDDYVQFIAENFWDLL